MYMYSAVQTKGNGIQNDLIFIPNSRYVCKELYLRDVKNHNVWR